MNQSLLDEVLASPDLPTLPEVAMRVIELCRDENAGIRELGEVLSHDPALSASVLRTVNSSYYGLRHRIGSVQRAVILLGLHTVKTLALGFSVIGSLRGTGEVDFDPAPIWSRGLLAGVAAQSVCHRTTIGLPDVAFIGGVLQDIGVIALLRARPRDYIPLLEQAGSEHRLLLELENEHLGIAHPQVGAALAEQWRFPDNLIGIIAAHEAVDAAEPTLRPVVREVALGTMAADCLLSNEPERPLRDLDTCAAEWFGFDTSDVDGLLDVAAEGGGELTALFEIRAFSPNALALGRSRLQSLREQ